MNENIGFIVTFSIMMMVIMILHGCTKAGIKDSQYKAWNVELRSMPSGECSVSVSVHGYDEITDDSITLEDTLTGG